MPCSKVVKVKKQVSWKAELEESRRFSPSLELEVMVDESSRVEGITKVWRHRESVYARRDKKLVLE